VRLRRPAVVALVLCLGAAAGLPAVWLLNRPPVEVGSRPSAEASPGPGEAVQPADAGPAVLDGASARSSAAVGGVPSRVRIPALGIDASVVPVGVAGDGSVRIPSDARRVGWYRFGPRPGGGAGSVVLAAHVDSRTQGLGVFAPLSEADPGDRVVMTTDRGRRWTYQVVARERFQKRSLPLEELFRRDGREVLTLITCGGAYLADAGGYQDNVVVSAVPVDS
jgi:sortase (surface protein transpeptidase)